MAPTKNPTGQLVWYDAAIEIHTVARAMSTERAMAASGRLTNDRAAAGGPTMRVNMSRAPTTGTDKVAVRATRTRKSISTRNVRMPAARASSEEVDERSNGH